MIISSSAQMKKIAKIFSLSVLKNSVPRGRELTPLSAAVHPRGKPRGILRPLPLKSGFDLSGALILALSGYLGAGKTTFAKGFIAGAGIRKKIASPSFTLIKNYGLRIKNYGNYKRIYHIDCYRIKKPKELLDLGLKEILKNPRNIVLIEWPERIKKYLPKNAIRIKFKHGEKENERIINFK